MIREEVKSGVIVEIRGDYFWVVSDPSCKPQGGCLAKCGGCGGKKPAHRKKLFAVNSHLFAIGEPVIFRQYILNENIAALLVFGIPIIMALSSMILWYLYAPKQIESVPAVLTTILAFAAGFPVVRAIDFLFSKMFPSSVIQDNSGLSSERKAGI